MEFKVKTKQELEDFVSANYNEINDYICKKSNELPMPIYSSVDIREGQLKYAPIDHNLFPAGFNNICALDLDYSVEQFNKGIKKSVENPKVIGILTESNTKNTFYLDHLAYLKRTLEQIPVSVKIISFDNDLFENDLQKLSLLSNSKFDIEIHKASVKNEKIIVEDSEIDFCLLNNDQSRPIDIEWDKIQTHVCPSPLIGWNTRKKSIHFCYYSKVVEDFSNTFSIDPNLIQAKFKRVNDIDYSTKEGLESLAKATDDLLSSISYETNVFIKADQGTYGMGISTVKSGEEILNLNRKKRNKMDVGKNNKKFTSAIVQEGVKTILKYDDMPAEVTIYLVDGKSIGGFMRANSQKGDDSNLNSKGMIFKKFCISEIKEGQDHAAKEAVYSVIARLSTMAAGLEIKNIKEQKYDEGC